MYRTTRDFLSTICNSAVCFLAFLGKMGDGEVLRNVECQRLNPRPHRSPRSTTPLNIHMTHHTALHKYRHKATLADKLVFLASTLSCSI